MRVSLATSAARPDHTNEDFAGAVAEALVLLDGAGIAGAESICAHGVAWYTHRLGGALLSRLSREDGHDLTVILAAAIDEIAADHRNTCDLTNPSSPQATVLMVRATADNLEYLLLADSFLVLDRVVGGPRVITDEREVAQRRACSAPLAGIPAGTPEYQRIRDTCVAALRARRNQPGGYWIAKDDPRAAAEAVTGAVPLSELNGLALLSNGASRIVDPYAVTDWPGLLAQLDAHGPAEVIRRIRQAEDAASTAPDAPVPDDATIAHCTRLAHRPTGGADH